MTVYVDGLHRPNASPVSTGTWSYTAIGDTGATAEILSNQAHDVDVTDLNCAYRAEQALGSTDHYCQVTAGLFTTSAFNDVEFGALCRCDASAKTAYFANVGPHVSAWKVQLWKIVAGVYTVLLTGSTLGNAPAAGDTLKLTVIGSTLTAYYNGGPAGTVTDTAITTGVRCGFYMARLNNTVDVAISELRFGLIPTVTNQGVRPHPFQPGLAR